VTNYKYDNVEVYYAKHLSLPFEYSRKKRGDIAIKAVNKVIKDNNLKFDLIHAHTIFPSGYVGAKLKEKFCKPLIITGHGGDVYNLPFRNDDWNKKIRKILNETDHIITVSGNNYKMLKQLDLSDDKISIIPNGYDSDLFKDISMEKARDILNLPKDKRIILSVGDLELVKGQRHLIQAMEKVAIKEKNAICLIIGLGAQKKNLQSLINKLNLGGNIKLIGEKPHDEIPLWMNASDLFVLPSLAEGNPTVMFEALGCACPFIGTKVGGIPEVITSEKLGILVEPEDNDGLAEAILKALDIEWDKNYILNYSRQFMWDKIAEDVSEVYNNIIGP